jgi:ribokinase
MSRVFVLGNATVDIILDVARLPAPGETLLAGGLLRCAGGKGLNQAVAAARAAAPTTLVAPVGEDADAALLRATLTPEGGLDVRWRTVAQPTDVSTIWVAASGENAIVSSAACARALHPGDVADLLGDLESADVLLVQGNLTAATTLAAMLHGRDNGARVVLNTAPIAWDMSEALALADIVVANEPEASALTGRTGEAAVRALLAAGPASAVLTLGARGALLASDRGVAAIPAPMVAAIDTAGAGDVMVGTLAAEVAARREILDAVALAVSAASLSVSRRGTSPSFPTPSEIDALRAGLAP